MIISYLNDPFRAYKEYFKESVENFYKWTKEVCGIDEYHVLYEMQHAIIKTNDDLMLFLKMWDGCIDLTDTFDKILDLNLDC